jgi:hypothetical protein
MGRYRLSRATWIRFRRRCPATKAVLAPLPGKKGSEIPILGRIVAIADVYDALSSKRSYKEPWDESRSIEIISQGAGTHFDPELVEIFLERIALHPRHSGAVFRNGCRAARSPEMDTPQ